MSKFMPGSFVSLFGSNPTDPGFPSMFTFWGNQADAATAATAISNLLTASGNTWYFDPGQPSDFSQRVIATTDIVYGVLPSFPDPFIAATQIAFACCGSVPVRQVVISTTDTTMPFSLKLALCRFPQPSGSLGSGLPGLIGIARRKKAV